MKIQGSIDATGSIFAKMLVPGQTVNVGLKFAASTLSVCQADGTDFADTDGNRGYICVPSATAGQWEVLTLVANATIQDDSGTEQILGRWGTTASVAWASAMPFFLYAVNKASVLYFSMSRDPRATTLPASGDNIGDQGAAPATSSQSNHVIMADITPADFASLPCMCIGSFTMTCDNSAGGKWTVGAFAQTDGIGRFQEGVKFIYPAGQNGNVANYYWKSDASADIPTYAAPASIVAFYFIDRNGFVDYTMTTTGAGNCTQDPGAGAVDVLFELPYAFSGKETTTFMTYVTSRIRINNVMSLMNLGGTLTGGATGIGASFMSDSVANTALQEDNWGDNAADDVSFRFSYSAF